MDEDKVKQMQNPGETDSLSQCFESEMEPQESRSEKLNINENNSNTATIHTINVVHSSCDNSPNCSDAGAQMVAKQQQNDKLLETADEPIKVSEDTLSIVSSVQGDICRICHCQADEECLISPCECCGTLKYVHQSCLQMWVKSSDTKKCELCGYQFHMTSTVKPFTQWKKMDMSTVERRKVLCSVTFHVAAITCVIWSLYVLIDKTTQEIRDGNLNWPFWTKLVVVAIGFTGGLVFMYVQCKMYVQLFRKWKQFNRVIYIKNVPDPRQFTADTKMDVKTSNTESKLRSDDCLVGGAAV